MDCLPFGFAWENVVDARYMSALNRDDYSNQVHAKPELLSLVRMRHLQMVESADHKADLCGAKEQSKHGVVLTRDMGKSRFREILPAWYSKKGQYHSSCEMSVHIACLVVHEGQAGEDVPKLWRR
jgi:hypothetical protein